MSLPVFKSGLRPNNQDCQGPQYCPCNLKWGQVDNSIVIVQPYQMRLMHLIQSPGTPAARVRKFVAICSEYHSLLLSADM